MRNILRKVLILAALLVPALALAKPLISITMMTEKEVTVVKNGEQVKTYLKVKTTSPGDTIMYTLEYENKGDEVATDVLINDPIPQGTSYVAESATGPGSDITYSIDKGKTYKKPSLLSYEVKLPNGKMEKRVASSEEYSNIRWVVKTVPAGGKGKVTFKVHVK